MFITVSTINHHPTFQYSQPEEYHFSHDSVFLARWLAENPFVRDGLLKGGRLLDLCSGTGVIGLDLAYHLCFEFSAQIANLNFDFVEVQAECRAHFNINCASLKESLKVSQVGETNLNFFLANYESLYKEQFKSNHYDFIVCNPPYFNTDHGKLSPSQFKNRSRFFIDSNLNYLMRFVCQALKPNGNAFILLKDLRHHGQDTLTEAHSYLENNFTLEPIYKIRGTDLVKISQTLGV